MSNAAIPRKCSSTVLWLVLSGLFPLMSMAGQRSMALPILFSGHHEAELSGTYRGHAPASDAARRVFTLRLAADGTATLDTLYIGRDHATERAHWTQTGNQVEVSFESMGAGQPPRPIVFRHRDHQLNPVHWDASEWGRAGPPVLHREQQDAVEQASR